MKETLIELLEEVFFSNGLKTSIPGWVARIIFYGTIYSIGYYTSLNIN